MLELDFILDVHKVLDLVVDSCHWWIRSWLIERLAYIIRPQNPFDIGIPEKMKEESDGRMYGNSTFD